MTAKEVRKIRAKLALTQQELADKVGVARNTVSRWELGTIGVKESAARLLRLLSERAKR